MVYRKCRELVCWNSAVVMIVPLFADYQLRSRNVSQIDFGTTVVNSQLCMHLLYRAH